MRNILLFALVGLTFVAPVWAQVCVPPPSGMVSWWPGDGNANDIIGSNNGTLQGGVTFAPGKVAQAFSFNGVDGYVNAPNNNNLNPGTSDFTVDFWMKMSSSAAAAVLNKRPVCTHSSFWAIEISGGVLAVELDQDSAGTNFNAFNSTITVNDGNWHLIALVRQGTTATLYIDGQIRASGTTTGVTNISNTAPVLFGNDPCIGVTVRGFYQGLLDEVEFFNRALSASEILAIFAAGSAGKCKPGSVRAAYVANAGSNTVSVINPTTNTVVATVPVGANPVNIAVTPNGASAYVTNAGSNTVSVINTTTNTVMATVPVGANPVNVAVTPNGASAYVTNAGSNTVSVINTATNIVVATVTVGFNPVNVAITPDGASAYVTNAGSNTVSVINTTTNTVVATVLVGFNPVNVILR